MAGTTKADSQRALSTSLAEITRAIAASLDVAGLYSTVAEQSGHILAFDAMAVLLLSTPEQDQHNHDIILAYCFPSALATDISWSITDFSFGPAVLANQSVIEDLAGTGNERAGDDFFLRTMGQAALILPLQVADRPLGALVFVSKVPGVYGEPEKLLAEPIAGLLALALEHQRLNQQASALAVVEERNRIAREIHDTLAQSLAGIIINLEALKPYSREKSQVQAEVLTETEGLARGALEEARRSVLGLQPTPLQHKSLLDALSPELTGLAKRAGLDTQFYTNGVERPLAPDVATALFRVAQEAFQNIYKHASARHVILGLAFEQDEVVLTIEDDGLGFVSDAKTSHEASGFGLLSMAARARSLAGDLLVSSRPGHGTAVRASLPYLRPFVPTAGVVLKGELTSDPTRDEGNIRVLIVDDHGLLREGIRRILEGDKGIQVVGEAEDGLSAIDLCRSLQPDVILLDIQMPVLSGLEALPRLLEAQPSVEIVILTMFDQDEQIFAALKAGARGYLLKDAAPETIIAAIRAASRGEAALAPALATRLVERFAVLAMREVDPDALTDREKEVLICMNKGMRYKEIATHLGITMNTVQYHVSNVLHKLGVGSRSEAVVAATQRGLLNIGK